MFKVFDIASQRSAWTPSLVGSYSSRTKDATVWIQFKKYFINPIKKLKVVITESKQVSSESLWLEMQEGKKLTV